jgi:hypothetical protein
MRISWEKWLALPGVCLLSACAVHGPPPPPPLTALPALSCVPALTVQGVPATPVLMDKEATVTFDAASNCMMLANGQPTLYSVFRLPVEADAYLLTVRSLPVGEGMIIPRLMLMAENNLVLRTIEGESFTFHGASMMTKLRSHPGEVYLVVAVDTRYVGQEVAQVAETFVASSSTSVIGKAVVSSVTTSGASHTLNYVFSYNGSVVVSAEPMPKV